MPINSLPRKGWKLAKRVLSENIEYPRLGVLLKTFAGTGHTFLTKCRPCIFLSTGGIMDVVVVSGGIEVKSSQIAQNRQKLKVKTVEIGEFTNFTDFTL